MVFVLIPPGTHDIGDQDQDPSAPFYAQYARKFELGVNSLRLDAFLISKYELTQGQWVRQTGSNPSYYAPQDPALPPGELFHPYPVDLRHPLEHVGLLTLCSVLSRMGMEPPSGAQWETVARAGNTDEFPPEDWLRTGANLFDLSAAREAAGSNPEPWDDGYWLHAPIGTYAPNTFGLHDVYGNVSEYTSDPFVYSLVELRPRDGDGRSQVNHPQTAIARGGVFSAHRGLARFGIRMSRTSSSADSGTGIRPVRRIER